MAEAMLIQITADGKLRQIPADAGEISGETLCALLQTDVTERLRLSLLPAAFSGDVICYFIDARGGDKQLPANFAGTCFYHTGCPVFGDLLLARCAQDADSAAVSGFTQEEAALLCGWLREQFPDTLT